MPFFQYKQFMLQRYGTPLFRIPVDTGYRCPHRRQDGSGGCDFCAGDGARAIQTRGRDDIIAQVRQAVRFAKERYRARRFLLYLQAFTPSQMSVPVLDELLQTVHDQYPFDVLSLGARPDCLSRELLDYLGSLSPRIEAWVELGVQTVHDDTLLRIHRGHDQACSDRAVQRLNKAGIPAIVHTILGLPGETEAHFRQTAQMLARRDIQGIKIHNLHVIKGTPLATRFHAAPFPVYDHYAYGEILMDFLRRLPADLPVMRINTDTPPAQLEAPHWAVTKGQFRAYIVEQMINREWAQGDLTARGADKPSRPVPEPVFAEDGSFTFWSDDFREHYHAPVGAWTEATRKYAAPGRLRERLEGGPVHLLDVCFGLGWNSFSACRQAVMTDKNLLRIDALEMDRRVVRGAAGHMNLPAAAALNWSQCLRQLYDDARCRQRRFEIFMHWGDARYTVRQMPCGQYDLIFLDPFSTQRNSPLWTVDFFCLLRAGMKPDGMLLTYCAAIPVRAGLLEAGFHVGETYPVGRSRGGTIAVLNPDLVGRPLPQRDGYLIRESHRGIPYRDPGLCASNSEILRNRQQEILEAKQQTAFRDAGVNHAGIMRAGLENNPFCKGP